MTKYLTLGAILVVLASVAVAQTSPPKARARRSETPSTLRLLNQRLPEVRFDEQPLDQVMDWLADFTQLNVVVHWQVLQDSGVNRDQPISLHARNLRLSQVLWMIMNEAGGSELSLAYRASGNMLILSTEDDLGKEVITRVYDVTDLALSMPSIGRPEFSQQNQGLGQSGQSGGGGSVFGQSQTQSQQNTQTGAEDQMTKLVDIIQKTVEPDTWVANGGSLGHIEIYGKLLIVRNTIYAHQQLAGFVSESETESP